MIFCQKQRYGAPCNACEKSVSGGAVWTHSVQGGGWFDSLCPDDAHVDLKSHVMWIWIYGYANAHKSWIPQQVAPP